MPKISTVAFHGKSGRAHVFDVYHMDQEFNDVGAVYAVTRRHLKDDTYKHQVIYVGQTDDLSTRFNNHHKQDCFAKHNANCICVYRDDDEDSRLAKEADLIAHYDPPCND